MAYSNYNYGTGIYSIKPSGENIIEQAYNPLSNYISSKLDAASLAREAARQNGMKYTSNPVQPVQTNPLDVFTGPNARLYDAATGRLKHGVVVPNTSTAMFQHDMMKGVPQFGPQAAAAPSLLTNNQPSGWSSMFAPDFFKGVGDTAVTSNIGSRPSVFSNNQQTGTTGTSGITSQTTQQVRRPVATDTAVVQQQQPPATVDTQPTTSQPISPIGLQGVTDAMNAQSTMGNPIPQSANTQGWFGTAKNWLGEKLGVDATQYLTNTDGTIMMTKENIPIINADATTWKDVGAGVGSVAQMGMGIYDMFQGYDHTQQQLDTQRGQLNLMRDKYEEDKRKNQAIVAQNRRA